MRAVRVWFTKLDTARFISHLDMNRMMTRALRRARLPIWYTEGFNPHPYMTFSLPLPLGVESEFETMDIRMLDETVGYDEICARLNEAMPHGIRILKAAEPQMDAKEIYCADYEIKFSAADSVSAAAELDRLLTGEILPAEKKMKQGRRKVFAEINLLEYVITYTVMETTQGILLKVLLLAGQNKNLSPVLLAQTLSKQAETELQPDGVVKIALYNEKYRDFQ